MQLDEAALTDVRMGRRLWVDPLPEAGALALAISPAGEVAALLRSTPEGWQPDRVLST